MDFVSRSVFISTADDGLLRPVFKARHSPTSDEARVLRAAAHQS